MITLAITLFILIGFAGIGGMLAAFLPAPKVKTDQPLLVHTKLHCTPYCQGHGDRCTICG